MFYNLKYAALASYMIITLFAITFGVYFEHKTVDNVIKRAALAQSVEIGNTYKYVIWNKYLPVLGYLADQQEESFSNHPQYLAFKHESDAFFDSKKILGALVGNQKVDFFKSQNHEVKGKIWFLNLIFSDVGITNNTDGNNPHAIIIEGTYKALDGKKQRVYVRSFIPLIPQNSNVTLKLLSEKSKAILQVDLDVTKEVSSISFMKYLIIFAITSLFGGAVICALFLHAEMKQLLERQQEISLELQEVRRIAENESKDKSKFLANVSHELRTPLNAIIGFSEIISNEFMGPLNNEQYKEFINDIHTSGINLLNLINDILDFSKAEEDKLEIVYEDIDLTKLVKVCSRLASPRAEQSKVLLKEELPSEHIMLYADPKHIKQVLLNLLYNAVKFTPADGVVTIKIWNDTNRGLIIIEISDTGVGMEPQDIIRALEPFNQVDNKLSRRYGGTGLGLPLAKKLVELMKGKFEIKSEIDIGTTVILSFPITNELEQ